jgi:hypothetical protein
MPAMPRPLAVLWAGMVIALIAFLAFGSLRIGAGNWIGRRMPVRNVWSRFLEYLTDQGASPALVTVVVAAAAVTLVTAAYLLWLSFSLEDQRPDATDFNADDPART